MGIVLKKKLILRSSRVLATLVFFFTGVGFVGGFSPALLPIITVAIAAGGIAASNVFGLAVLGVVAAVIAAAVVGGLIGYGVGSLIGYMINRSLDKARHLPPIEFVHPPVVNPNPNPNPAPVFPNTHVNLARSFGGVPKPAAEQQPQPVVPQVVIPQVVVPQVVIPEVVVPQVVAPQANAGVQHPDCFKCPLTGELMKDPYISWKSGATLEKAELEAAMGENDFKNYCYPNRVMQEAIEQYTNDGYKITDEVLACFEDKNLHYDLMKDPVVCLLDEITYERDDIVKCLQKNKLAPNNQNARVELKGNETIDTKYLITNEAAKHAIAYIQQQLTPSLRRSAI
jgi:hypothetical protein